MHARVVLGVGKGVLFREFKSVLIEGFHCTTGEALLKYLIGLSVPVILSHS